MDKEIIFSREETLIYQGKKSSFKREFENDDKNTNKAF